MRRRHGLLPLAIALTLGVAGCAELGRQVAITAAPEAGYGIAVIGVESDQPIDKLDLCSDRGCVDAGVFGGVDDLHAVELAPDEYCVSRLTGPAWSSAGVGILELHEDVICFEVRAGQRRYVGHVKIEVAPSQTATDGVRIGLVQRSLGGHAALSVAPPTPRPSPTPQPAATPTAATPTATVGAKLSPKEILVGIERLRDPVIRCAQASKLDAGAQLRVQFTVDGPSGAATEARLTEGAGPEALGQCIRQVVIAQGPGLFPSSGVDQQSFVFVFRVR